MWYVFDVNETSGYIVRTRSKTWARIVTCVMGGNYDYGNAEEAGE